MTKLTLPILVFEFFTTFFPLHPDFPMACPQRNPEKQKQYYSGFNRTKLILI